MVRKIIVVPYNPDWPNLYSIEARKIAAVLAGEMMTIRHIGSTAVPGIKAKPIIDFLIEVHNIERVDEFKDAMMELRYEPRGENGIPGRRYFIKNTEGVRTHHVHIYQTGHPNIERHVDFRDYMRTHPEEAKAYSFLKEELVQRFREDSLQYTEGKGTFIREIDRRAAVWKRG